MENDTNVKLENVERRQGLLGVGTASNKLMMGFVFWQCGTFPGERQREQGRRKVHESLRASLYWKGGFLNKEIREERNDESNIYINDS